MEIDSTPLDILVAFDDGVIGRVELTGTVDLATRTVTAGVLRPATKSVDAALLLARTVTPEPMRPGWVQALSMARSVLPWERMLTLDERLEHAAARPVIIPETIVYDKGGAFISANFRAACRLLGISLQPAHPRTGTDKPHIERTLESVGTLFAQHVSGYTSRSAEYRGRAVDKEPLWPVHELQEQLDEWLVAAWQNRPHDGLRDALTPGQAMTPNEKYAALVEAAGSRLARAMGQIVSRFTLIRALPDPEAGQVTVLGVDDFAKRKGASYATSLAIFSGAEPQAGAASMGTPGRVAGEAGRGRRARAEPR